MDDRQRRFRVIYDETYEDLWRYCLRRCTSTAYAEDALSDTFAVAWRRFDEVPEPPDARPYLFGIARNLIRDHHRRSERESRLTQRLQQAVSLRKLTSSADGEHDDDIGIVLQALHQLSDADQEVLRLAAWEQVPHAEIAAVLGCSVNAVGIRLHRARNRLAERTQLLDPTIRTVSTTRQRHHSPNPALTSERKQS